VHGVHLEIVSADEKLPSGSAGPVVYWHADNFDGRLQELLDCGATLYRGPIETADGLKMAQVQDPWGNVIGIRGRPSDPD